MAKRNIGKLKCSIKNRCPECGKNLQIRTREASGFFNGYPVSIEEEYIACSNPNCYYEEDVKSKRRRLKDKDGIKKPKRNFKMN